MHRQGRSSEKFHNLSMTTQLRNRRARRAGVVSTLFCVNPGQCLPILGTEAKTYIPSGEEGKRGEVLALGSAHLNLNCFRQW